MLKSMDIVNETRQYFGNSNVNDIKMSELAEFSSGIINPETVAASLQDVLSSEELLTEVSASSYRVTPHFLKLLLQRESGGWGLRLHLFDPAEGEGILEPWHEHRWMLASTVLSGNLSSRNAIARRLPPGEVDSEAMYLYKVPDKRRIGNIAPEFAGQCLLTKAFDFVVPSGHTYAHHVDLAHGLVLNEPTLTAVLTSPDARTYASFIEPQPLKYTERPNPTPLTTSEAETAIRQVLGTLENPTGPGAEPVDSPVPDLLYITR